MQEGLYRSRRVPQLFEAPKMSVLTNELHHSCYPAVRTMVPSEQKEEVVEARTDPTVAFTELAYSPTKLN